MDKTLVLISPLGGFRLPNGNLILTKKFVDGLKLNRELWDGPILHICAPGVRPGDSLDNIEVPATTPEFNTVCDKISRTTLDRAIPENSVVLSTVGEGFNFIGSYCRKRRIPCVYLTEYNLKTRRQILDEIQPNPLRRTVRKLRETIQEARQRSAISASDAVQCNGLPTYKAYKEISKSPLLFFDSRIEEEMIASDDDLLGKIARRNQVYKINLVFSGRLNVMKGVDDLPKLAAILKTKKIPFEMSICGDGEYRDSLREEIEQRGVSDCVALKGNLDFERELMPFVREGADLFVCCHRQGDPSCTYLETMACGVPIVGYGNDAFRLLADHARVGFPTPMGDVEQFATTIADLYQRREIIDDAAWRSRDFAAAHSFRRTFQRRIDHLKSVVRN
jgi:colanic acid/amylovoran biosynthesis glycosyltransferase